MHKICKTCNLNKLVTDFARNYSCKDGRANSCKDCLAKWARNYKSNNKEKVRKSEHRSNLKTKYGLTEEDYNLLLIKQNYCCAICGIEQSKLNRKLHVDHCHKTMKIRGLLCSNCNKVLGVFKDNINRFQSAIKYLHQ